MLKSRRCGCYYETAWLDVDKGSLYRSSLQCSFPRRFDQSDSRLTQSLLDLIHLLHLLHSLRVPSKERWRWRRQLVAQMCRRTGRRNTSKPGGGVRFDMFLFDDPLFAFLSTLGEEFGSFSFGSVQVSDQIKTNLWTKTGFW
uniref:Uncharacterized protein n=1 Tax=Cacopsylla melanoneura TaxID=428564 RepID=A0A8D9EPK3_9HEMI